MAAVRFAADPAEFVVTVCAAPEVDQATEHCRDPSAVFGAACIMLDRALATATAGHLALHANDCANQQVCAACTAFGAGFEGRAERPPADIDQARIFPALPPPETPMVLARAPYLAHRRSGKPACSHCCRRAVFGRPARRAATTLSHVNDTTDHPSVIDPPRAGLLLRQVRPDHPPGFSRLPEQRMRHLRESPVSTASSSARRQSADFTKTKNRVAHRSGGHHSGRDG